jgi:hypothetical protein
MFVELIRLIKEFARFVELSSTMRLRSCQWLNVTCSCSKRERNMILFLRIIVSIISSTNSLRWKNIFLLIFLLIFVSRCWFFDHFVIWRDQQKEHEREKIAFDAFRNRETCEFHSSLWIISFISKNDLDLMREIFISRITNREVNHFDRVKIQIEFFVMILLKFIKNDHLSWMRNVVNFAEWMQNES